MKGYLVSKVVILFMICLWIVFSLSWWLGCYGSGCSNFIVLMFKCVVRIFMFIFCFVWVERCLVKFMENRFMLVLIVNLFVFVNVMLSNMVLNSFMCD